MKYLFLLCLGFVFTACSSTPKTSERLPTSQAAADSRAVIYCEENRMASDGPKTQLLLSDKGSSYDAQLSITVNKMGSVETGTAEIAGMDCDFHVSFSKEQRAVVIEKVLCEQTRADEKRQRKEFFIFKNELPPHQYEISEVVYTLPEPSTDGREIGMSAKRGPGKRYGKAFSCRLYQAE